MKLVDIPKLDGLSIARWVGTEMALAGGAEEDDPVLWEHSSVPYLQLISVDIQLSDGSVYRMYSNSNDGSGYYGLYLMSRDTIDTPASPENGSIYRTRDLVELPIGQATVAIKEVHGPDAALRVEIAVSGHSVSFWAAEVYERGEGQFDILGGRGVYSYSSRRHQTVTNPQAASTKWIRSS